jgi:hypothetical protein
MRRLRLLIVIPRLRSGNARASHDVWTNHHYIAAFANRASWGAHTQVVNCGRIFEPLPVSSENADR